MKPDFTLADILEIENSPEVLSICCPDTGIPLWSMIRGRLHRMILGDFFYAAPLTGGWDAQRTELSFGLAATISKSFAHNAVRLQALDQQYPVLVMATGARMVKREEQYFNCLSDYFISAAPDRTFAIEDLFDWRWPFPRHHNNVLIQVPLRVTGVLWGQLRGRKYREPARALVDLVIQRARDFTGWSAGEDRRRVLESFCASRAGSLLPRYQTYKSIFKKMGGRLLIKEEACYGGADNAAAIVAARHSGMVIAEYQHGSLSGGHNAYNFGATVLNSRSYLQTLPDYLLVYGSWWGEQINAPMKKITIGNPHRAETLDVLSADMDQGQKILVLGDGHATAIYLDFCERLAIALGSGIEVLFRPHPLERTSVWAKYPDGLVGKVRVDAHQDLYSSFREAGVVISEVSTGLFEAIGLVPKVFIWDTPKSRFAFPKHPFRSFSDVSELASMILDASVGRVSPQQMEGIWASHWKRNYLEFLEKVVPQ